MRINQSAAEHALESAGRAAGPPDRMSGETGVDGSGMAGMERGSAKPMIALLSSAAAQWGVRRSLISPDILMSDVLSYSTGKGLHYNPSACTASPDISISLWATRHFYLRLALMSASICRTTGATTTGLVRQATPLLPVRNYREEQESRNKSREWNGRTHRPQLELRL